MRPFQELSSNNNSVTYITIVPTDESDYTLSAALLTFQTGSTSGTTVCTALNIEPDDLEEKDEKVVVRVFPVAPDVVLDGVENSITLTILNDDGTF